MISSPGADTDMADVLISVVTASVHAAAGFAGIDPSALWALQRQTDARMIHDATRCLEAAGEALSAAAAPTRDVHEFAQRLLPFDRIRGRWRMLVDIAAVPLAVAESAWKFGELNAAVSVRSTQQRFRFKDLAPEQYVRLCRTLLDAVRHDREDLDEVPDDLLLHHLKHGAAAFVWFLMLNVLSELRDLAIGPSAAVRMTLPTHVRVSRALAAPESAWRRLREWLARSPTHEPQLVFDLRAEKADYSRRSLAHHPLRISMSR